MTMINAVQFLEPVIVLISTSKCDVRWSYLLMVRVCLQKNSRPVSRLLGLSIRYRC